MSDLTFSVTGVSLTQCNPLSKTLPLPAGSTWNYYYYLCPNQTVNVTVSNPKSLPLNVCIFAQGAWPGPFSSVPYIGTIPAGYTLHEALPGGGGGGQVVNINTSDFTLNNFSIVLQPTSWPNNLSCQLLSTSGNNVLYTNSLGVEYPNPLFIQSGSVSVAPTPITIDSNGQVSGGKGGSGGNGGGAAGNCGAGGSIYYTGTSPATINIYPNPYTGPNGDLGTGYNPSNTGQSVNNTPNSTNVNFADGTSANIAQAGKQMNAGNVSGFLIYYEVSQV